MSLHCTCVSEINQIFVLQRTSVSLQVDQETAKWTQETLCAKLWTKFLVLGHAFISQWLWRLHQNSEASLRCLLPLLEIFAWKAVIAFGVSSDNAQSDFRGSNSLPNKCKDFLSSLLRKSQQIFPPNVMIINQLRFYHHSTFAQIGSVSFLSGCWQPRSIVSSRREKSLFLFFSLMFENGLWKCQPCSANYIFSKHSCALLTKNQIQGFFDDFCFQKSFSAHPTAFPTWPVNSIAIGVITTLLAALVWPWTILCCFPHRKALVLWTLKCFSVSSQSPVETQHSCLHDSRLNWSVSPEDGWQHMCEGN